VGWNVHSLTRSSDAHLHRTALWSLVNRIGNVTGAPSFFLLAASLSTSRSRRSCKGACAAPLPAPRLRSSAVARGLTYKELRHRAYMLIFRGHPKPLAAGRNHSLIFFSRNAPTDAKPFSIRNTTSTPTLPQRYGPTLDLS